MTNKDTVRLLNLLKMTTSTSDGEALNAIRLANKLLAKFDLTWDDLHKPQQIDIREHMRKARENGRAQRQQAASHFYAAWPQSTGYDPFAGKS